METWEKFTIKLFLKILAKPIIVDSNQELQDEFENLDFFHDFDDFISSNIDKIDGAIISTPSSLHLEHAKPFISKGIPLLIENL